MNGDLDAQGVSTHALLDPTVSPSRHAGAQPGESSSAVETSPPQPSLPAPAIAEARSASFARVRRIGWTLIGLQLLAMLGYSAFEYARFSLTSDFGAYSQAWWQIAHGDLSPWNSVVGVAFWRNNAEFLMWPLALLYHLYPHPVMLLWVQDVVVVATELVTFSWIVALLEKQGPRLPSRAAPALTLGSAIVMVLNPWVYETIAYDFHLEPFVALFVVLLARDLWAGRSKRLWWWVALALACGALGALCVIGVGLSGVLAGQRTRRTGLFLCGTGVIWLALLSAVGGAGVGGRLFAAGYGYLAGSHSAHVNIFSIALGILRHPGNVLHMFATRWFTVFEFVVVMGLVGLFTPWGFGVPLMIFLPTILNAHGNFLLLSAAFQSWAALPFVLVGSVMLVARLASSSARERRISAAIVGMWAATLLVLAPGTISEVLTHRITVDAMTSAQLARVEADIPVNAEVIVSTGVVGRFSEHDYVYAFPFLDVAHLTTSYPVRRPMVVFVFVPHQGNPSPATKAAIGFAEHRLGAREFDSRVGVYALEWSPALRTRTITLP